ncbi:MAG: hypothetical protein N2510_05370 [Ignavibacteria bacterium]|nr:hypothetical protein [Ignavibacteria bacterium]
MRKSVFILIITFLIQSCGEKLDMSQFPVNDPPTVIGDTVYIPIQPVLTGFNEPSDIYIGHEPVIYIADKGNNRIVQMDMAGAVISYSNFILRPKKIAQDRNYDLLVIASVIDTIPPNILDTVDAVFRYKLFQNGGILAGVNPAITFKSNQPTPIPGDHGNFTGIATFRNNYYLVCRSGRNNQSLIDPDNAIFKINRFDNTQPVPERLSGFEVTGQGLMSLQEISGIVTFPYSDNDIIYIQKSPNAAFKVQWCIYDEIDGIYLPKFQPGGVDLLRNGLLVEPSDICLDRFNNIYITDSYKDSLYRFNSQGKLIPGSFGGRGTSLTQFLSPGGVAHFYKTLYICDTGNNRILRFRLSTDIN